MDLLSLRTRDRAWFAPLSGESPHGALFPQTLPVCQFCSHLLATLFECEQSRPQWINAGGDLPGQNIDCTVTRCMSPIPTYADRPPSELHWNVGELNEQIRGLSSKFLVVWFAWLARTIQCNVDGSRSAMRGIRNPFGPLSVFPPKCFGPNHSRPLSVLWKCK